MFDTSTWFSSSCHQHIVLKPSATCCYWLSVLLTSTCCCYWKLNMKTSTSSSTASLSTVIFHCCTTFCFHQVSPASASTASQQNHMKFRWGTSHNCNYESDVGLFFFPFRRLQPDWTLLQVFLLLCVFCLCCSDDLQVWDVLIHKRVQLMERDDNMRLNELYSWYLHIVWILKIF